MSIGACAVTTDRDLQRIAAILLRSAFSIYSFSCSASVEDRPAKRDPSTIQRYTVQKEYFEFHGEFHISFSRGQRHISHTQSRMFRMTDEVRNYIKSHKYFPPRQIYRNLIQMTSVSFEKPAAQIITRKQVYNFWLSLTQGEWHRDFSLTPIGTNKHGFELYCVLTEYDLVSLPLSSLLHDTRVTAASLAYGRNNDGYNHHLCLWHSLRAISQHISGKAGRGSDLVDTARISIRKAALPPYLHFLCGETEWMLSRGLKRPCTADQANVLRIMIKRHLLRHPILPKCRRSFDMFGAIGIDPVWAI
ncbi:uncharacterized protein V1513DRAFT_480089 [Lipomyces chichibuensis]|uniref:uncharacterized protein n=1 Tax=Lipomyces chichibuensis TaxID=1546026 RepID=UPI0033430DD4